MKRNFFEKAINLVHFFAQEKIVSGDVVVDATCGNGHDTVFLARCVGPSGKVYAFDVQEEAINRTRERLRQENFLDTVELICTGHEHMQEYVPPKVKAVLFNLGFLPQGDKTLTTCFETTISGIKKSLEILDSSGIILIVFYPGHKEGSVEKDRVIRFTAELPQREFNVFCLDLINQANNPPSLLGIEKRDISAVGK